MLSISSSATLFFCLQSWPLTITKPEPPGKSLDGSVLLAASSVCPSAQNLNNWHQACQLGKRITFLLGKEQASGIGCEKNRVKKGKRKKLVERQKTGRGNKGNQFLSTDIRNRRFHREALCWGIHPQIHLPSNSKIFILLQNVMFLTFAFHCDPTTTKGFPQLPKSLGCKVHTLHTTGKVLHELSKLFETRNQIFSSYLSLYQQIVI